MIALEGHEWMVQGRPVWQKKKGITHAMITGRR